MMMGGNRLVYGCVGWSAARPPKLAVNAENNDMKLMPAIEMSLLLKGTQSEGPATASTDAINTAREVATSPVW